MPINYLLEAIAQFLDPNQLPDYGAPRIQRETQNASDALVVLPGSESANTTRKVDRK
jgi:hypothetical protein